MISHLRKGLRPFFYFWLLGFGFPAMVFGQAYRVEGLNSGVSASFRAVSVVNDSVMWVAGTQGTVGRSVRGPGHFRFDTLAGFGKSDFRCLYAFDGQQALVANAGSPAVILRTMDGGVSWQKVYENQHPAAFFDGIDFWDEKNGAIYGDPIQGKMLLLLTQDGGKTWNPAPQSPVLEEGEASFAASGTGIKCLPDGELWLATGGSRSRLWVSQKGFQSWKSMEVPVIQGKSSQGIFSFDISPVGKMLAVGGDYLADSISKAVCFWFDRSQNRWIEPNPSTRGYRECVRFLDEKTAFAIGPKGMDWTKDGGKSWALFSAESGFHVLQKARKGKTILLAGGKGKLALLQLISIKK